MDGAPPCAILPRMFRMLLALSLPVSVAGACQQASEGPASPPPAQALAPTAAPEPAPAPATQEAPIVIELWHDTVCPWCRIGHAHLDEALEGFEHPTEVVYRPFLLDPGATDTPTPLRQVLAAKYGAGRLDGMFQRVTEIGRRVGLTFRFDEGMTTASSLRSHVLLDWAPPAKRGALLARIHKAYFEDHAHIASPEVLADLARAVGLDREAALAAINDPTRSDRVRAEATSKAGIRGVPHFRIGAETLHGAQPAQAIRAALDRAAAARQR